jgi:hypothetical protein
MEAEECLFFVIFRLRVNPIWLIIGGGLLGAIYKLIMG